MGRTAQISNKVATKLETINYIDWNFVYVENENVIAIEANENDEFLGQINTYN